MKTNIKNCRIEHRKGSIEFIFRDEYFDPIYKSNARINDKKELRRLMIELEMKGLSMNDLLKADAFNKYKGKNKKKD